MTFTVVNSAGANLACDIVFPETSDQPVPVVVFSHGFGSGRMSSRSRAVAAELAGRGIASCLFDYTGHGDSDGTAEMSTAFQQTDDLDSVVRVILAREEFAGRGLGINAASSGAIPAVRLAGARSGIAALVLRGPRVDDERASKITVPCLIVQGENDPLLPYSRLFFSQLRGAKVFEVIRGADHLFSTAGALERVVLLTGDWFEQELNGPSARGLGRAA